MQLTGKRAFITGGTRGIGAAIALDFARGGARVAINARTEDDEARATLAELAALGSPAPLVLADVGRAEAIGPAVEEAARALGGLDLLVHCAGGPSWGKIEDVSTEQWNETFDVHVHAAFHLCRHALPHLKRNAEGAIVLVSSVAGLRGCPGAIAYGTAKGAILQFTRMLARDLADHNIRVNCVAPGIIRTKFHERMTREQQEHNLKNRISLHREGTAEEVADVVRLLATNDFMTGEFVTIDGGMSMQIVR